MNCVRWKTQKVYCQSSLLGQRTQLYYRNVRTRSDEISLISSENVQNSFRKIEWVTKGTEI